MSWFNWTVSTSGQAALISCSQVGTTRLGARLVLAARQGNPFHTPAVPALGGRCQAQTTHPARHGIGRARSVSCWAASSEYLQRLEALLAAHRSQMRAGVPAAYYPQNQQQQASQQEPLPKPFPEGLTRHHEIHRQGGRCRTKPNHHRNSSKVHKHAVDVGTLKKPKDEEQKREDHHHCHTYPKPKQPLYIRRRGA